MLTIDEKMLNDFAVFMYNGGDMNIEKIYVELYKVFAAVILPSIILEAAIKIYDDCLAMCEEWFYSEF